MTKFRGFPDPKSNYFRLPNCWTDITHDITSLAELKVIEYVLRHTWGWTGQKNRPRRISIDEFIRGRKSKKGKRLDRGTGLSAGSVSAGVKLAVKHGYLRMIVDETDRGRVKRYFAPVMLRDNKKANPSDLEGQRTGSDISGEGSDFWKMSSKFQGDSSEFEGVGLVIRDRTKKENYNKNNHKKDNYDLKSFSASHDAEKGIEFSGHFPGEEQQEVLLDEVIVYDKNKSRRIDAPPEKLEKIISDSNVDDQDEKSDQSSSDKDVFEDMHKREKKKPTQWDIKAAEEFAKVVSSYRKVNRTSDLRKWADVFRRMREVDKVPKKEIRETIEWYRNHIGEDYIPVAYSAEAFRRKFAEGKFSAAMKRLEKASAGQNGKVRITYENQREVPSNLLAGGAILKIEVDKDGRQYDGILLYKIRKRLRERFGPGRPLPEELKQVLEEDFPDAGDIPLSIIGNVG